MKFHPLSAAPPMIASRDSIWLAEAGSRLGPRLAWFDRSPKLLGLPLWWHSRKLELSVGYMIWMIPFHVPKYLQTSLSRSALSDIHQFKFVLCCVASSLECISLGLVGVI